MIERIHSKTEILGDCLDRENKGGVRDYSVVMRLDD